MPESLTSSRNLTAAGLRLTILDQFTRGQAGAVRNFEEQRQRAIAHHHAMVEFIEQQTKPAAHVPQLPPLPVMINSIPVNKNILGHHVSGDVLLTNGRPATIQETSRFLDGINRAKVPVLLRRTDFHIIDWGGLRAAVKAENTDIGEKMEQTGSSERFPRDSLAGASSRVSAT